MSTEPMYFYKCLTHTGVEAALWSDPNVSAFDAFDSVKPSVFISHWKFLTSDILKYLSQNKSIKLVLNVTFAGQDDLEKVEQVLEASSVVPEFLFTNQHECLYKLKAKNKLVNIIPAVDIFIQIDKGLGDWKHECAALTTKPTEQFFKICSSNEVHHKLCFGGNEETFDINVDVQSMPSLCLKYKKLFIVDDISVATSQIMFEASLRSENINIQVPEEQKGLLGQVLMSLFQDSSDKEKFSDILKSQVLTKHNCFKRTARLARLLKDSECAQKLEKIGEQIKMEDSSGKVN
tara:strand:+ start:133 stop:1005 length:873 start_codon:yes stop_codon:yes gene_type:complete